VLLCAWVAEAVDSSGGENMNGKPVVDKAETIARSLIDAYERKDYPGLMRIYAKDAVIEIPFNPLGGTADSDIRRIRGEKELELFLVPGLAKMRSVRYDIEDISTAQDGARVFIEARGDFVTDEGKPYRNRYIFRLDIKDGRVVLQKEYFNVATATAVFGEWVLSQFKK
jgi:ketosteroid isomerase-like protein